MKEPDLDQLFAIVEASPLLDGVENELHKLGRADEAGVLCKLQQDAGVQIDREFSSYDENEPAPGPETARLNAAFEPVTAARLNILKQICQKLPDSDLKNGMTDLMDRLGMEATVPPTVKPGSKKPGI